MALFSRKPKPVASATPLDGVDVLLADLDGVVYAGPHAIPTPWRASTGRAARPGSATSRTTPRAPTFRRRAPQRTRSERAAGRRRDLAAGGDASALRADRAGALVLVIGGDGLIVEVEKAGYRVTRSAEDLPDAVVQGFTPEIGWAQLAEAAFALAPTGPGADIPWVATNTDWTIPVARGIAPGNGTLVLLCTPPSGACRSSPASRRCRSSRPPRPASARTRRCSSGTDSTPTSSGRTGRHRLRARAHRHRQGQAGAGGRCRHAPALSVERPPPAARTVPGDRALGRWQPGDASTAPSCASAATTCRS